MKKSLKRYLPLSFILLALASCSKHNRVTDLPNLADKTEPTQAHILSLHNLTLGAPDSASAWGKYGNALLVEGFDKQAATAYQYASELAPDSSKWVTLKAVAWAEIDPEYALKIMQEAYNLGSKSVSETYYLAYLNFTNGNLAEAEKLYKKVHQSVPKNIPILTDLAKTLFLRREYAESLEYFRKLYATTNSKDLIAAYVHRLESALNIDLSELKSKESNNRELPKIRHPYYDNVVMESRSADVVLSQAYAVFLNGDYKKSDTLYGILNKELRHDVSAEDLETWALVKLSLKQNKAAKSIYRDSILRFPKAFQAHINLADILFAEQEMPVAEKFYDQALSSDSPKEIAQALRGKGRIKVMKGNLREGLDTMLESLKLDSSAALTHEDLGRIYGDLGDYDAALEHLSEAQRLGLRVDPGMVNALRDLQKRQQR